jgi:hypothetical protein
MNVARVAINRHLMCVDKIATVSNLYSYSTCDSFTWHILTTYCILPRAGLNRHPLDNQSNAITTTPTVVYIVNFWRFQLDSEYLHMVIVITQREQKTLSILRLFPSLHIFMLRVGLNHHRLSHQSNAITTTPTAVICCKSWCDQMDTAYIYIVMVSGNKRKRMHFFKPGVSKVRMIILSSTWAK